MGSSVVFWVFCLWVAVCEENGRTSRSPRFFEFRYEFTTAKTILKEAKASGVRMAVLETQSCNENAIAFYQKNGFEIIGFDLYSYSNTDPERHEIRIEMGKKLG